MKLKLHGTRGSYPTSKKDNQYYGGSTPCIEIVGEEKNLVVDAGTGIMKLNGSATMESQRIDILLTHLHMDHIQGLGFLHALFDPAKEIHIWGPGSSNYCLFERLNRFLSPPLFPVHLRSMPNLHFHDVTKGTFQIGEFNIRADYVIHPGPTFGFTISKGQVKITYIPDHEPMVGDYDLYKDPEWISGYDLAKDATMLIHDSQYSRSEYKYKIGWGHSSMRNAAKFAKRVGAKHLLLFHHDPDHSDRELDDIFQSVKAIEKYPFEMELAREDNVYEYNDEKGVFRHL